MMRMTTDGFARLARLVQSAAERHWGAEWRWCWRVVTLEALGASVVAVVRALDAPHIDGD